MKNLALFAVLVGVSVISTNSFAAKLCGSINSRANVAPNTALEVVEDFDDAERVFELEGVSAQQLAQMQAIDNQNQFFCLQGSYIRSVHSDAAGPVDGAFVVTSGSAVEEQKQ